MQDGNKKYLPDSIYGTCTKFANECDKCSNLVYSQLLDTNVHDTLRGKVFCPFGTGDTMNQNIFNDQMVLNKEYKNTKWGHAPQLEPRSLVKIGLDWRTS